MFLLNEFKISQWAYWYCRDIKDDPEIREFITNPYWAYMYCEYINKNDERLYELEKPIKGLFKW